MCQGYEVAAASGEALTAADFGMEDGAAAGTSPKSKHISLFADYTVQSYFRRPDFTPDGALFIAPTGIHRPPPPDSKDFSATGRGPAASFCTHVFYRNHMASPIASLAGLEDPSVSVRCCPVLFELVRAAGEDERAPQQPDCMVPGRYRAVFAVTTLTAVYIYDTQHHFPLARVGGLHFACINDAAWSADGASAPARCTVSFLLPQATAPLISLPNLI